MVQSKPELLELSGLGRSERRRLRLALSQGQEVSLGLCAERLVGVEASWFSPMLQVAPTGDRELDACWDHWRAPVAREEPGPPVTVVIPSHRQVPIGLKAWSAQDLPVRILVLSNGLAGPMRTDLAELIRVPWLGHGATRQAALEFVEDPYLLFTVDDAVPLGAGFIRQMVEALEGAEGTPRWDAVIARQLPWPDADPVTVARLRAWTPATDFPSRVPQTDHVATLYRTQDLRDSPLLDVSIAEDAWWSRGRRIACVPSAPLVHSHSRRPLALYSRTRDIHRERRRMGEEPTVGDGRALLSAVPSTLRPVLRGRALESLNQLAELVGQYRGGQGHDPAG